MFRVGSPDRLIRRQSSSTLSMGSEASFSDPSGVRRRGAGDESSMDSGLDIGTFIGQSQSHHHHAPAHHQAHQPFSSSARPGPHSDSRPSHSLAHMQAHSGGSTSLSVDAAKPLTLASSAGSQLAQLILSLQQVPRLAPLIAEFDLESAYERISACSQTLNGLVNGDQLPGESHTARTTSSAELPIIAQPGYQQLLSASGLHNFVVQKVIGTGTFGTVQLVQHRVSQEVFALKSLDKRRLVMMRQVEHVKNERVILSSISHPFITKLYKSFQDADNVYMLLEYASGGELFDYIRRNRHFNLSQSRFFTVEILDAIGFLHDAGIAYRDLKPENVLLDSEGHVKLCDFGFAKPSSAGALSFTMCGTPEYLAPEVIMSKGHDRSIDFWALGVLLYEMLAGFPPFSHQKRTVLFEKIVNGGVSYPSHFDQVAISLIAALLQVDPYMRLGNMVGGIAELKRHPFFDGIAWDRVRNRQLEPPIVPRRPSYSAFRPLPKAVGLPGVDVDRFFAGW